MMRPGRECATGEIRSAMIGVATAGETGVASPTAECVSPIHDRRRRVVAGLVALPNSRRGGFAANANRSIPVCLDFLALEGKDLRSRPLVELIVESRVG
jgi:hypothetical protein